MVAGAWPSGGSAEGYFGARSHLAMLPSHCMLPSVPVKKVSNGNRHDAFWR